MITKIILLLYESLFVPFLYTTVYCTVLLNQGALLSNCVYTRTVLWYNIIIKDKLFSVSVVKYFEQCTVGRPPALSSLLYSVLPYLLLNLGDIMQNHYVLSR